MKRKIVIFDLETIPIPEEVFRQYTILSNYPGITFSADLSSIICIGWKIFGEKKTHCINAWDFKNWKKNKNDDSGVLKEFLEVIEDADGIITQNGKKFDFPFLQTRLLLNDIQCLPEYKHSDLKNIAKKLKLSSKSLNRMGYLFGDQKKADSGGWQSWVDIYYRDCDRAKKHMTKYCKQDVVTTESVYDKIQQLAKGAESLPNMNQFKTAKQSKEGILLCPTCGSSDVYKNGWHYTNTMSYQRLKCRSKGCNSRLNIKEVDPRPV